MFRATATASPAFPKQELVRTIKQGTHEEICSVSLNCLNHPILFQKDRQCCLTCKGLDTIARARPESRHQDQDQCIAGLTTTDENESKAKGQSEGSKDQVLEARIIGLGLRHLTAHSIGQSPCPQSMPG